MIERKRERETLNLLGLWKDQALNSCNKNVSITIIESWHQNVSFERSEEREREKEREIFDPLERLETQKDRFEEQS